MTAKVREKLLQEVLDSMVIGKRYFSADLAGKHGVSSSRMTSVLVALVKQKMIRAVTTPSEHHLDYYERLAPGDRMKVSNFWVSKPTFDADYAKTLSCQRDLSFDARRK